MTRTGWTLIGTIGITTAIAIAAATVAQAQSASENELLAEAPAEPIPEPEDELARAAFEVLDKHCARCHQDGRLVDRINPAKNFGNVLRLDEIATDTKFVFPGNPDASQIVIRMGRDMPYDVRVEPDFSQPDPTPDEVATVRKWIASLGETATAACSTDSFVDNAELVQAISADLNSLEPHRVEGTRYVTLTHLRNACVPDKEMKVYRQAVVKLLNSLSTSSDVVRLETIDEAQTIIRFHLDDTGWSEKDWDKVIAVYPYAVKPDTTMFSFLQTATKTRLPYVRGDWLAFAASRPPLYHDLLKLPDTFDGLQKDLGIDVAENIKKFLVKRAGFQNSGVSQNNRLIERHSFRNGPFWTSYDFAGSKEKQSLFQFPLGPHGEFGFDHDGGETIFALPNGFHAYYLNTAKGKRIDKGPTEIVRDPSRRDAAVTNGISCLGCHAAGIQYNDDDIRAHVEETRAFPKTVRDAVRALYPTREEMKRILDDDKAAWDAAMKRAGLDPSLRLNQVEMINALSDRYERHGLDLNLASAEFGLTPEDFEEALSAAGGEAFALKRRLEQGLVPRDHFEVAFAKMVSKVSDDEVLDIAPPATETATAEVPQPSPEDRISSGTFHLTLYSDKSTYKVGDLATFTVESEVACHLTLINVDSKEKATVIFPNKFHQDNAIAAKKPLTLPEESYPFRFQLGDPGTEKVVAICETSADASKGLITHDYSRDALTPLGDYEKFVTRQIQVIAAPGVASSDNGKKPLSAKTAITFKVH